MNNKVFIVYFSNKSSRPELISVCANIGAAVTVTKKRLAKLTKNGYAVSGKEPDEFELSDCSMSRPKVIKLFHTAHPEEEAEVVMCEYEVIGAKYRTREEEILHFQSLACSIEREACQKANDPVLLAKAEAYRLAAFDLENNTTEGWRA